MKRSMKRMGRNLVSGVLVCALVFGSCPFIEAKKVNKQESVYVNAAADGTVKEITVADWLKNSGVISGTVSDASNLTDITNVKGEETFTQSEGELNWNTSGSDIYYQGKSSGELPVEVSITYSLDGKEIPASELPGKSGLVKIHVSYTNKSRQEVTVQGKKTTVYTPFVLITGMILPTEKFSQVEVDNGRLINDGSNQIVVGVGTPGLAESLSLDKEYAKKLHSEFTITAQVTDFSMGNTFTYASPSLLNELQLDKISGKEELEDSLSELTDAAAELVDGTDSLSENMELFADSMGTLEKKIKKYRRDGVKKVTDGISELAKSGPKLVKGVGEYADGVTGLADGVTSYVKGAEQIAGGNSDLYEAVKNLPSQIAAFDKGLKTYTDGVDKMGKKENVTALKAGAKAVSDGVTTLNASLTQLKNSFSQNEQIIAALKAGGADAALIAALEQVTAGQKAAIEQLETATSSSGELKKGADSLSSGVNTVMDGLSTLSGNSSQLTGVTTTLNGQIPKLVSSVKTLKEGGETLTKNDKKLLNGAKKLKKASKTMKQQSKQLNNGMKSLKKGGLALNKATDTLVEGVSKLETASGALADGAEKAASGMEKFQEKGIKKLEDAYQEDIKGLFERLDAVIAAGKKYNSFSGIGKGMKGDVKFIIETEALEKEE
ncbi:MAG: hypothetical protein J1F02_08770 [Lachnospiraceae bacterium]|nr:hypothetical protein [Lachnospiraceae bacterium]